MSVERWQSYIDQIIEEARERGEFDLTNAKGKKLHEDGTEPHQGEWGMAHKVLANSGHAPAFLMKKREIDERLEQERARLLRYALRRRRLHQEATTASTEDLAQAFRERAEADWRWAVQKFDEALPELNRQIELFNLMNKIPSLFKMKLRLEWEIERIEKQLATDAG